MAVHRWLNNFTGGEWTPFLDGRNDLEKYDYACRTLENVRPLPYGGARIRGGLKFINEVKTSSASTRIWPFVFSTGTRFIIEAGNLYFRFYKNGARVETSPGVAYEVSTPYITADLFDLHFRQINDIVYITHPDYHPYKLSRVSDTSWTMAEVDWTYPPLREENTSAITMACSNAAIGTGRTLTAAGGTPFVAGHVGAYFEIRHLREGDAVELAISATGGAATQSSALTVKGDWSVVTTERWYGTLEIQRSLDGGSTWKTARKFKSAAERNVSASGSETEECLLRLQYTPTGDPYGASVWVGTAPTNYVLAKAKLECAEAYASGLVKVTGYTDSTHVTVSVIQTLASTAATDVWSEGAWSTYRGFPAAVGLYEQRIVYGCNAERPVRKWGSVTGDFDNFTYGTDDDAAFAFDVATAENNAIQWIQAKKHILIGTTGTEHSASSGDDTQPLSPANIAVRDQSSYGSTRVQPVVADEAVLFVQRQGKKLREMSYDAARDGWIAPDLTLLAEHVTSPGIVQLAFARQPDPLVLAATGAHLAVMTYNREQNITAWARYTSESGAAYFESVATIYGDTADEVWCVVKRTVGGNTKRYIEKFSVESDDKAAATFLDSHVTGTLSAPFSGSISGLSHLEGKTVKLVVAGAVIGSYTVASGAITVDTAQVPTLGAYVVGLPYRAVIQPMRLEIPMANGPSAGRTRRISKITFRFKDTLQASFGQTLSALEPLIFRDVTDDMDDSPPVQTGEKIAAFPGGHDKSGTFYLVQDDPLPFTMIGIAVKADFADN